MTPWRREWQPTPVFLSGEFSGQSSLSSYSPWGCTELDMTDWQTLSLSRKSMLLLFFKFWFQAFFLSFPFFFLLFFAIMRQSYEEFWSTGWKGETESNGMESGKQCNGNSSSKHREKAHLFVMGSRTVSNEVVVSWLSHFWLFCDPMDCSLPGSSVHGISQARILE